MVFKQNLYKYQFIIGSKKTDLNNGCEQKKPRDVSIFTNRLHCLSMAQLMNTTVETENSQALNDKYYLFAQEI